MAAGDELTHIGSQKCRPVWIPFSRPLHLEGAGSGAIVVMRHGGQLDERVCQFHRQRDELLVAPPGDSGEPSQDVASMIRCWGSHPQDVAVRDKGSKPSGFVSGDGHSEQIDPQVEERSSIRPGCDSVDNLMVPHTDSTMQVNWVHGIDNEFVRP